MNFNEKIAEIMADETIEDKAGAIAKMHQSEADRIRGEYVKKNKTLEQQLKEKELEGLSEIEKAKALFEEQQREFEQQKKEWMKDRLIKEKTDFFKEKKLPLDIFDLVDGETVEDFEKNSSKILEIINKQVEVKIGSVAGRDDLGGNKTPEKTDPIDKSLDAFKNAFK